MKKILLITAILLSIQNIQEQAPVFGSRQIKGPVESDDITEASGMDTGMRNPDVLWINNDSGDLPRVFAAGTDGKHLGICKIENAGNRDWEDIAAGPGPDDNTGYIYIADIGDNEAVYDLKYIYRIPEPEVSSQKPTDIISVKADVIRFMYPDGRRDAETILIDPLKKDIYIVSKREKNVRVYLAEYPQPLDKTITLKRVATLPLTNIVGGDISNNGSEIILKDYDFVYYWKRTAKQTIAEALLNNKFFTLPYKREIQGESICWSYNADGYYTVSEESFLISAYLYFYERTNQKR